MTSYNYEIVSAWPGRVDTPTEIGRKFFRTLDALARIDPIFCDWARIKLPDEIPTERTPDGGLLMIAAETRFDPTTNREHRARSRILAEIMIKHGGDPVW